MYISMFIHTTYLHLQSHTYFIDSRTTSIIVKHYSIHFRLAYVRLLPNRLVRFCPWNYDYTLKRSKIMWTLILFGGYKKHNPLRFLYCRHFARRRFNYAFATLVNKMHLNNMWNNRAYLDWMHSYFLFWLICLIFMIIIACEHKIRS